MELVAIDVRVASHGREAGVAEVLGDKAGVAAFLAQPGRGSVAQRVGGDVLLDPGARGGSPDDVGEDRLLQASTVKPTEDRVGRLGLSRVAQPPQGAAEASRDRLTPGLVALPVADEQGPPAPVELEVAPLERAQLRATQAGRDEREQHELVTLRETRQVPLGLPGGVEQPLELLVRQPVALLPGFRRRVEIAEGVERTEAPADPAGDWSADRLDRPYRIVWWVGLTFAAAESLALCLAVWPRIRHRLPGPSATYFDEIALLGTVDKVKTALAGIDAAERTLTQLVAVARIVRRKYVLIRWAMGLLGTAIVLVLIAVIAGR